MKVIPPKEPQKRVVTLRIDEKVMEMVDKKAEEGKVSRQRLVEAILDQVLNDRKFVLRLDRE